MTTNQVPTPNPFPTFAGPYGHVYWIEKDDDGEPFGDVWAAPQYQDGTFHASEGMPIAEFSEPLTHGQLLDVLLGLGAAAIVREKELRAALEGLCAAGEAVMDEFDAEEAASPGDAARAQLGLGKSLDHARKLLGIPDDYSTADYGNLRESA